MPSFAIGLTGYVVFQKVLRRALGISVEIGVFREDSLWIVLSCFMNMINYYLLKGQSEFLHVKQKQLPCLVKVCACAFWLIAGQVTQHNK